MVVRLNIRVNCVLLCLVASSVALPALAATAPAQVEPGARTAVAEQAAPPVETAPSVVALPATASTTDALQPPETRIEPAFETRYGITVEDPYRWLEDLEAPETRDWFASQDRHARAILDALPGRAALQQRIATLNRDDVRVVDVQMGGSRLFYLKRAVGENQYRLTMRETMAAPEQLLIDAARYDANGQPASIDFFRVSPNGRRLAFGIALGGEEVAMLHVIDVDTGREVGTPLPRMSLESPVQWRIDSGALFYTQLNDVAADADPTLRFRDEQMWMRDYGVDGRTSDRRIFGRALDTAIGVQPDDVVRMATGASSWAVVTAINGNTYEMALYVAPLSSLRDARPRWRRLLDAHAGVVAVALRGEWLYLLSNAATNGTIVRWSLADPRPFKLADAEVVLAPSDRIITGMGAARDALYVVEREVGYSKLRRLEYNVKLARAAPAARASRGSRRVARAPKGPAALPKVAGVARASDIALPFAGDIKELVTDATRNGALLAISGWTEPRAWYAIDGKGAMLRTPLLSPVASAFDGVTVTRVFAKARDGVDVPVTVLARTDVARDGSAPLLLNVYGAYGLSLSPTYRPSQVAWIERGGVVAFAHVRGGGELGEDWHRAGMRERKPNTWRDLIDVADWLVRERWTSPAHLAIRGGSAGGIAVGNALIERPELFRAVVSEVGVHDLMRSETTANGPSDVPETGTVEDEAGFRMLFAMSSYHRVREGVAYPAVLLTTGYNDPRVAPWSPGKMAAQLQAAATTVPSPRPVLLAVDFAGGHGLTATQDTANRELADSYAFMLWQFGDPVFQPASR